MADNICVDCGELNPINAIYCQSCGRKLIVISQGLIDKIINMANEEVNTINKLWEDKLKNIKDLSELFNFNIEFNGDHDMSKNRKLMFYTIIYESIMSNYTFEDNIKKGLAQDLIESTDKQLIPYEKIKIMSRRLNGNNELAEKIENTEIIRASNLSEWAQNKAEGVTFFIIDFCNNPKCIAKFEDQIFDINDVDNIPPIYLDCGCIPSFFYDKKEAKSYATEISKKNAEERKKYEEPYATGYIAFNLAEEKIKNFNKSKTDSKEYLEIIPLLNRALSENISINTKAKVYRMIGDIYYKNVENDLAVSNFEKALSYNPKVGVKRLYDKLK